jgi:hypothetical protein
MATTKKAPEKAKPLTSVKKDKAKPVSKDFKPNPKHVPLGSGLADRAKGALADRKKMLDEI